MNTKILVRNQFYTLMPIMYWFSLFLGPAAIAVYVLIKTHVGYALAALVFSLLFNWLFLIMTYGFIFSFLDMADRVESIDRRLRKAEESKPKPPSPEQDLGQQEPPEKNASENLI